MLARLFSKVKNFVKTIVRRITSIFTPADASIEEDDEAEARSEDASKKEGIWHTIVNKFWYAMKWVYRNVIRYVFELEDLRRIKFGVYQIRFKLVCWITLDVIIERRALPERIRSIVALLDLLYEVYMLYLMILRDEAPQPATA